MDMGKTWRIGNDAVGNEGFSCIFRASIDTREIGKFLVGVIYSVASFVTRSPAALNVLRNISSSLRDITTHNTPKPGHQARILDHESHQFGGVATNTEEF